MEETSQSQLFLSKIKNMYDKKMANSIMMDRVEYNSKLSRLLELANDHHSKKHPNDFRLLKAYDVLVCEGSTVPKLCKRDTNMPYVPIEDLYDVINDAHVLLGHAGRNSLQNYLRTRYCNITKDCIMQYLDTCKDCPRRKRSNVFTGENQGEKNLQFAHEDEDETPTPTPTNNCECPDASPSNNNVSGTSISTTSNNSDALVYNEEKTSGPIVNTSIVSTTPLHLTYARGLKRIRRPADDIFSRGQVDVFDMQKDPDGDFRFILRYTNLSTHEVRLRALKSYKHDEVANILIDIYCEQGAPAVLQSINGKSFAEQVVNEILKLWPQCRQLYSSSKLLAHQITESKNLFFEHLSRLMKVQNTNCWAGMLRYLQWEWNTTPMEYNPSIIMFNAPNIYSNEGMGYTNTDTKCGIRCAPIECSLGRIPSIGLPSQFKLIDIIYDKVRSEEQVLEYIQDADSLRQFFHSGYGFAPSHPYNPPEKRVRIFPSATQAQKPCLPIQLTQQHANSLYMSLNNPHDEISKSIGGEGLNNNQHQPPLTAAELINQSTCQISTAHFQAQNMPLNPEHSTVNNLITTSSNQPVPSSHHQQELLSHNLQRQQSVVPEFHPDIEYRNESNIPNNSNAFDTGVNGSQQPSQQFIEYCPGVTTNQTPAVSAVITIQPSNQLVQHDIVPSPVRDSIEHQHNISYLQQQQQHHMPITHPQAHQTLNPYGNLATASAIEQSQLSQQLCNPYLSQQQQRILQSQMEADDPNVVSVSALNDGAINQDRQGNIPNKNGHSQEPPQMMTESGMQSVF